MDGELNTGVEILSETLSESVGIPTDFEKADQKAVTDLEAITLKIGDRVSDLNGQLGIVELLYPDGEVGVAHDNGQFKMWKPSELTIVIPDDDGDPDSNGSGNLPVTPKPNNDDGGVVQFEPLEQAVAEATDDVAVTTSSAQKDQPTNTASPNVGGSSTSAGNSTNWCRVVRSKLIQLPRAMSGVRGYSNRFIRY